MRVVTTGHGPDGRGRIVRDSPADPEAFPGTGELLRVWSTDRAAVYPYSGVDPGAPGFFPDVGGVRVCVVRLLPAEQAAQVGGDLNEVAAGLAESMDSSDSGMHTTDTTDFVYVLSGAVEIEVDGQSVTTLSAGDLLVQNGTRHRWTNHGCTPAELLLFLVGAERATGRKPLPMDPGKWHATNSACK
jgi:mannose-6-phosphate isomerase-like protein (cupin superfamily)